MSRSTATRFILGSLLLLAGCGTAVTAGGDSPLESLLGVRFENVDEVNEAMFARSVELTEQCMIARGFKYEPSGAPLNSYPEGAGPGTNAWNERYGFGVSTTYFPQPLLPGKLIGRPASGLSFETAQSAYVAGLGEDERRAYTVALSGSGDIPIPGSSQAEIDSYMASSDGCQPTSQRNAREEFPVLLFLDAYRPDIEDLVSLIESDPQMIVFEQEMQGCIAQSGLEWTTYPQVLGDLRQRVSGITLTQTAATLESQPTVSPQLSLSPKAIEALAELQSDELELASAFHTCEDTIGARQTLLRQLRISYERDFIDKNQEELHRFGAS